MDHDEEAARGDAAKEAGHAPYDEKVDYLPPFKSKPIPIRTQGGQIISGYRWIPWMRATAVAKD
jgi:hypothetical protein